MPMIVRLRISYRQSCISCCNVFKSGILALGRVWRMDPMLRSRHGNFQHMHDHVGLVIVRTCPRLVVASASLTS